MIIRPDGWQTDWKVVIKDDRRNRNKIEDVHRELRLEKLLSQRWLGNPRQTVQANHRSKNTEDSIVDKKLKRKREACGEELQLTPRGEHGRVAGTWRAASGGGGG